MEARVLKALTNGPEQTWEQISSQLPALDWNELFAIFDVLTRGGKITMRRQGLEYVLRLTHGPFATRTTASRAVARLGARAPGHEHEPEPEPTPTYPAGE